MVRYSTRNENETNSEVEFTTGNVGASYDNFATTSGGDQTPPMAEPVSSNVTSATNTTGDAEFVYRDFSNSEKVTASDFKEALAKAGEDIALAPANTAISALFNTASMGQDALVWGTEKVAHGLGYSEFSPYSYYKEHPEEYRAQKATAEEFSRTVFDSESYSRHKGAFDFGGEIAAGAGLASAAASTMKVGSVAYNFLIKAGVPSKLVNTIFWNSEVAANEIKTLKATVNNLAKVGINPSSVRSVAAAAGSVVAKTAPQAAKKTAYETIGFGSVAETSLDRPSLSFKDMLVYYGAVPAVLGVGLPLVGQASKTYAIFNRGAKKADRYLNQAINQNLVSKGLSQTAIEEAPLLHSSFLTNYGIAGNPASEVATTAGYSLKALKDLKQDALAKLDSMPFSDVTRQDVLQGFDDLISAQNKQRVESISELVSKSGGQEAASFVLNSATKAQDKFSNVLIGAKKLSLAPNTNKDLAAITNNLEAKRAELKRLVDSTRTKPENRVKYMEKLQDLSQTNYTLIDDQGQLYDMHDMHLRWRDSADVKSAVRLNQESVISGSGVKTPLASVKITDNEFGFNQSFAIGVDVAGNARISKYSGDTLGWLPAKAQSYEQTATYDPTWAALVKQRNWLNSKVETKEGQKLGIDKLLDGNVKFNIKPREAQPSQIAYWKALLDDFGEEKFSKLFSISDGDKRVMAAYASRALDRPATELSLRDLLNYQHVASAKDLMLNRAKANANKADKFRFNQFTEDSLFSELTGLKGRGSESGLANETVVNDFLMADEKQMMKLVSDSDELSRGPKKYALLEASNEAQMTDAINNQLFQNLAESSTEKARILTGQTTGSEFADTLVSKISQVAYSQPQLKNGWLDSPVSIGYNTTVGGKLGKLALSQESRHGNNVTLNASVSFNNELAPTVTKLINDELKPVADASKVILKDDEAMQQFGKFWAQARGGYRLADAEPEWSEKLGGYVMKLDGEKAVINNNVNEHLAKFSRVDGSQAIADGLLPDPVTGQPLVLKKEVADLLVTQQRFNKRLYQGNKQINSVIGRLSAPFMNYHMPTKDFSKSTIRVIGTDDGKGGFIPELYVSGNNEREALAMAKLEIANSKNKNFVIKNPEDIGLHYKLIQADVEQNYFRWADYNDLVEQYFSSGNYRPEGVRTSQGSIIKYGQDAMKEFLEADNRLLQQQAGRARSTIFRDQINQAMNMLGNKAEGTTGYDELHEYVHNLTGKPVRLSGATKKVYDAFDAVIDRGSSEIAAFRNTKAINRATEIAEFDKGEFRNSASFFKTGKEVEDLYGMNSNGKGLFGEADAQAARLLNLKKPRYSKEVIGGLNRLATNGLLRLANFGYALLNIASLPATMPMVRKALGRLPGESVSEWQSRIGAYGKVVGDGENLAVDLIGGAGETLAHYIANPKEASEIISEASSRGWLTMNANALAEAFINPVDTALSKGGKQFSKMITSIGDKSEEVSRIIPFLEGYRIAERAGFDHASRMSMARRFMDDCIGNYLASNRPLMFTQGLGSLAGLFYTYNHAQLQRYFNKFLANDKSALVAGVAAQALTFGEESLDKFDLVKDYLAPIDTTKPFSEDRDMYTRMIDAGFSDDFARSFYYGLPSAITGLDFSAKGEISAVAVPGTTTPPFFSLASNVAQGAWETTKQLASDMKTDPNTLWEIWQTRMPITAVRQGITAKLGYEVDRNHNLIVSKDQLGNGLWYASLGLSMNSLDERIARDAVIRRKQYDQQKQERNSVDKKNVIAQIRNTGNPTKALADGITNAVANGTDPSQIGRYIKDVFVKAFTTPLQQQQAKEKYLKENYDLGTAARLVGVTNRTLVGNQTSNEPVLPVSSEVGNAIASQPESRYHSTR